jgi:hypothetical protein
MLLGRPYNESAYVYSYAMCLVELVDRNLPRTGVALSDTANPIPAPASQFD